MSIATMTSKGQVTVPRDVREDMGLEPGSKLMFVKVRDGFYRVIPRTGKISDLAGILYDPARPTMSIEEMNEAIAEGGAESGMRGLNWCGAVNS